MRPRLWIGVACVATFGFVGCAARVPAQTGEPKSATQPAAADPMAQWDDSPPPAGAGEDEAPLPQISTEESFGVSERRVQDPPRAALALRVRGRLHWRRAKATGNRGDIAAGEVLPRGAMQSEPDYSPPPMFLAVALQEQH